MAEKGGHWVKSAGGGMSFKPAGGGASDGQPGEVEIKGVGRSGGLERTKLPARMYANGELALHADKYNPGKYTVTQTRSGYRIADMLTERNAEKVARALSGMGLPWGLPGYELRQYGDRIMQTIARARR
jgi:hypothetical protein